MLLNPLLGVSRSTLHKHIPELEQRYAGSARTLTADGSANGCSRCPEPFGSALRLHTPDLPITRRPVATIVITLSPLFIGLGGWQVRCTDAEPEPLFDLDIDRNPWHNHAQELEAGAYHGGNEQNRGRGSG